MGFLSTHILDTAQGKPANNVPLRLYLVETQRTLIKSLVTNDDGRTDELLLSEAEFRTGTWELVFNVADYFIASLVFNVADYFIASNLNCDEPPFLDEITLRFTMSKDDHYHVPLLVSPWSYSTYRGS
jgi:5-hydroxyisourate hydrolase